MWINNKNVKVLYVALFFKYLVKRYSLFYTSMCFGRLGYSQSCKSSKRSQLFCIIQSGIIILKIIRSNFCKSFIGRHLCNPYLIWKDVCNSWFHSPTFNSLMMEIPIIQKPVHWLAKQIDGLISIPKEPPRGWSRKIIWAAVAAQIYF